MNISRISAVGIAKLRVLGLAVAFTAAIGSVPGAPAIAAVSDTQIAVNLATLLRSARAVVSDSQSLINDASKGDKGLSGDVVVSRAKQNYKKATNSDLADLDSATFEGQLITALLDSVKEVMDESQERINEKGVGFKGFLPAIFAKAVADRFRKKKGDVAVHGSRAMVVATAD